ncbi:hypothetical protein BU15DRAFT_76497 [Melanogaster broomeanus]|nr:hypothetical protein BU15DRAFT_76497 [Melanogaster broomeanus]
MALASHYYKIESSTGKYLTLPSITGQVIAKRDSGALSQQWDVQKQGTSATGPYTMGNRGYDDHPAAYSTGNDGDTVVGKTDLDTEWNIVENKDGSYSIYVHNCAWTVGDGGLVNLCPKDKADTRQQFTLHQI